MTNVLEKSNNGIYTEGLNERLLKSFHSKMSGFPKSLLNNLLEIIQHVDIQPTIYMYKDNLYWEYKNENKELKFIFSNELAKEELTEVVINDEKLFTIRITNDSINHILREYFE